MKSLAHLQILLGLHQGFADIESENPGGLVQHAIDIFPLSTHTYIHIYTYIDTYNTYLLTESK